MTPHHLVEHIFYQDSNLQIVHHKATIERKIIGDQVIQKQHQQQTINNYNRYAESHNAQRSIYNKSVTKYNANSIAFVEQNNLQDHAKAQQQALECQFSFSSIYAFNLAVEAYNNNVQQPLLQKRKLPRLTNAHEDTFCVLVWLYARQIQDKSQILTKANATTTRALQRLLINHKTVAELKRKDGTSMLSFGKRTIQNHVKRLAECGVLIDYSYHGHQKPIQVLISDEILVLFDAAKQKQIDIENQPFTFLSEKNFHNNKPLTRTFINKLKIIEPVNKQSQLKGTNFQFANANNQKHINESTQAQQIQKKADRRQTRRENLPEISTFLYQQLQDLSDLCSNLANNEYKNYRFTKKRLLEKEVLSGSMPREAFRELLLQTFIKMVSPMYLDKEVYYAVWRKAYNLLNENELLNPNGSIPNKVNLLYKFENLVWRITYAKNYYRSKKDLNPLFPSQYFSPYRKTSKSGGFAYTIEALKKKQEFEAYKAKKKAREVKIATENNKRYKAIELVEKKVQQMVNKKLTVNQLIDYVNNNAHIPHSIAKELPTYIQRAYK